MREGADLCRSGGGGLEFLPEQECCGAIEVPEGPSCPLLHLLSSCALIQLHCCLVVWSKKAGQGPWHQAYGLALMRAQMSSNDGLIGLMCEVGLVPKGGPHVET